MLIVKHSDKDNPRRPSASTGGDEIASRPTLEFESLAQVDMSKLSQSELYALSRCSSSFVDLDGSDNLIILPDNHASTASITTTPSRIFAFSHRRSPHYRHGVSLSLSQSDEAENRSILNSLDKLVAEGECSKSKRKKKGKGKVVEEELKGLGVINVKGEGIDLRFLASVADESFEAELKKMTEGMVREDEFLGFLRGLDGRWGSTRRRRKLVDAAYFVKALPKNWMILLSLRPRVRQPSLYCRRFVSPSGIHFKSCKDVAFYLKSQFISNVANSAEEGGVMLIETGCQAGLVSQVDKVPSSQNNDTNPQLSKNKSTLNSGEVQDYNPHREIIVVDNKSECPRRKRKRKAKVEGTGEELQGLDVIDMKGEEVNLKFLVCEADGAFEAELKRMTEGLVGEDQLLGFLRGLVGQWGSSRKRRKLVDAAFFMKALPTNWMILLSLRPRHRRPSLYCRRYVSPSGTHFKSCKDVALYLKAQFLENVANPPEEEGMMLIETSCQVGLVSQVDKVPSSENDNSARQLCENKSTSNSLEKLFMDGEVHESNPCRDMIVVGNEGECSRRKRKKETKEVEESREEWEGLDVIHVNRKEIDLKFLARVADGAFEAELRKMTEGMLKEEELLGFLRSLEGQWGSSRKRRKLVDAAFFMKALPTNWKILLSLRPRHRRPSLYCRRYVSPSGIHFESCKDVAFYLKAQSAESVANPPEEGAMMLIEESGCLVDLTSQMDKVPSSCIRDAEVDLSGTNDLCNVPIYSLIECHICRTPFTSIGGLEQHLGKFHGTTTRRLDFETLTGRRSRPLGIVNIKSPDEEPLAIHNMDAPLQIIENSPEQKSGVVEKEADPLQDTVTEFDEPRINEAEKLNDNSVNGQASLILPEQSNGQKSYSEELKRAPMVNRSSKTMCIWCLKDFFCESVVAETLVSSSAFICPECKMDISRDVERTRQMEFNTLNGEGEQPHNVVQTINSDNVLSSPHKMDATLEIAENPLEQNSDTVEKEAGSLQDTVVNHDEPRFDEARKLKDNSLNGQASSSLPGQSNEPKSDYEVLDAMPGNFETMCMWCLQYFYREPVDAETLANSSGFICPTCKEVISGTLESSLSRMYPHADQ